MYNYYCEDWLIDRLAGTLQSVYGTAPCVESIGNRVRLAVLVVGEDIGTVACSTTWTADRCGRVSNPRDG